MTETGVARDLMHSAEIKQLVRSAYAAVDSSSERLARKLYSPEELAGLPRSAIKGALGVGNHLRHAQIDAGETLLDLGCGAGIDTILAAQRTGPTGQVIALDFLPEMLERTKTAAAEAGLANVHPLEGDIEALPLVDGSIDHVISNGVINLAPRKARVLAECARVLRPDGKLTVADLTVAEEELPTEILVHPATWAG
jgi:arsenite methyltransferase